MRDLLSGGSEVTLTQEGKLRREKYRTLGEEDPIRFDAHPLDIYTAALRMVSGGLRKERDEIDKEQGRRTEDANLADQLVYFVEDGARVTQPEPEATPASPGSP